MMLLLPALEAKTKVTEKPFGKMSDGAAVHAWTLSYGKIEAEVISYGGTLISLKTPDKAGNVADIVLGYDTLDGYVNGKAFFGALVGRYGNRIANARFALDGQTYHLPANDHGQTLHGGIRGFDKHLWTGKEIPGGVELTYLSKDGEEGFPGNLTATVKYTLEGGALKIDYSAVTDKDTVLNLTNHSYFNLAGQGEGDILGEVLTLNADRFTPVNKFLIPTGELKPVEGTPFDFRKATPIGERIGADDAQLKLGGGYDHNFVLNHKAGTTELAATVRDPKTGRVMKVLTDQPGVQFYSGNMMTDGEKGKGGKVYNRRFGFCLETQHFPDSPNHPSFPSTELKPGQRYHTVTVFEFSAE